MISLLANFEESAAMRVVELAISDVACYRCKYEN